MATDTDHPIKLIHSAHGADLVSAGRGDRLILRSTPRLQGLLDAAAQVGLEAPDALRLALERALVLADAGAFGLDAEGARCVLARAAAGARPRRPLTAVQAAYVRALTVGQPTASIALHGDLAITIPDRVLTRARGVVRLAALHADAVPEMVAWELAAALEGRTMGEWALKELAAAARHAA